MLTIIPNPKAMDYDKLIEFLNKRKNIELNRFKQRGNKNVKDIEYRINKETNRPELLELLWNRGHYIHPLDQLEFKEEKYLENNTIPATIQELVANDILDLSQYMFLTHEYVDDGFNMEIVLHGIFATLEEAGDIETEEARKHPEYASYQVSKIEATDETATATRNGQAKQVKIKNLYITLRKFISDKDRANMEADKKADDDKDVVNKLIN